MIGSKKQCTKMEGMIMRNMLAVVSIFVVFGIASWSIGQDVDEAACQQTIKTSCTTCHKTDRICHELGEADANWPEIIKEMGEKGKLSQEIQDTVLNCLTKAEDPKKFVCSK